MEITDQKCGWRGIALSAICPGAAHLRAGNTRRGWCWLLSLLGLLALAVFLILHPAVNLKAGLIAAAVWLALWFAMLFDARRARDGVTSNGLAVLVLLSFVCLYSLVCLVLRHGFTMPDNAMAPALQKGDRILSQSYAYWFNTPQRGDLALFKTDGLGDLPEKLNIVFRVAALPGEKVSIVNGHLTINDRPVTEPAFFARTTYTLPGDADILNSPLSSFVVPDGHYFLLGDNTTNAPDSRFWGPVPRKSITGRITRILWPKARAGTPE